MKLIFFITFFLSFHFNLFADVKKLEEADKLFLDKKYLDALRIYEDIWQKEHQLSAQMLMKMSFITENFGNYPKALYYLNLFYELSPSYRALIKMESLALSRRLKGFESSDFDFFRALIKQYNSLLLITGIGILFFLFTIIWQTRQKRKVLPPQYSFTFLLILASFFYILNFTKENDKGIIAKENTLVMQAPSSASGVETLLNKGNRVVILGYQNNWYKVRLWDNKVAFIRPENLWIVPSSY